jgi:hypothetical protein
VLVATWRDGLFIGGGETPGHELAHQSVRALAPDGNGGALAIVNGRSLRRRAPDGAWSTIATTEFDLACCVTAGDVIYVGTDDAGNLYLSADTGRSWSRQACGLPHPSSVLITWRLLLPPAGVRSTVDVEHLSARLQRISSMV